MPLTFLSPPTEDQAPQPSTEKDKGDKKKGKNKIVIMMFCKTHPGKSNNDNNAQKEDPFSDSNLVRDLIDKFAMFEVID